MFERYISVDWSGSDLEDRRVNLPTLGTPRVRGRHDGPVVVGKTPYALLLIVHELLHSQPRQGLQGAPQRLLSESVSGTTGPYSRGQMRPTNGYEVCSDKQSTYCATL